MPSTASLIAKLQKDFPTIHFVRGDTFHWSPERRTVYYADAHDKASLIHEVAHACLEHSDYSRDIQLLAMERDAWEYAIQILSKKYSVAIETARVETMLDTYRDWLHARSTCPECQATGIQVAARRYTCLTCRASWRVNEARSCALRRYNLPIQKTAA